MHRDMRRKSEKSHQGVRMEVIYFIMALYLMPCFVVGDGEKDCNINKLGQCDEHEMCSSSDKGSKCVCQIEYKRNPNTGKCEQKSPPAPPPPPPEPATQDSSAGLGIGIGISVFLIVMGAVLFVLHRKFGLFSGIPTCLFSSLSGWKIFGSSRGRSFEVVDDGDDDFNPIV
ncbi:uncharacterized protein LOC143019523 [Oratosquilla oratoria]|uniref:uncharacterized protein LOC143019523 n=1 Tax=Oratosquilla oratoria TaxID=337810 RepID=UPI003F7636A1